METDLPLITNDAVVLALLLATLAGIFVTSSSEHPKWQKFYSYVPSLLLCYFIPSIYNSLGIISGDVSRLYPIAAQYFLPASLVLLTLSIDVKGIIGLGPKAGIMFLVGSAGIVIGGPLAVLIVSFLFPGVLEAAGGSEIWRGLSTVAGSWIGGGANQTAMYEIFQPSAEVFSAVVTVDIVVANLWLGVLLFGAARAAKIDRFLQADTSAIDSLRGQIERYQANIARIPSLTDITLVVAIAFGVTGIAHVAADVLAPWIGANAPRLSDFSLDSRFFWIVVVATTIGLLISFTRFRDLEGAGASRVGTLFLYILVMTIGMKMDVLAIFSSPGLFLVGVIWMLIHVTLMLGVGKLIKAPFFFIAVGSQANVGGAASAPIVASAFHPALAPVGVLLAVLGYAVGTYGAMICAQLMRLAASF